MPDRPDLEQLADLDRRLRGLQSAERIRAERRQALDAHRLELRHFEDHLRRDELPDLAGLPLLRRSADRILDYLAESEMELAGMRPGPLRRIRNYFRYGSVRALDPADTGVVLRLQLAYYHKRIAELEREIERLEDELRRADFEQLSRQHQQLSAQFLHSALAARYRESRRTRYRADSYRQGATFNEFIEDYPALLSTCHSLPVSIADGYLLDYLIIDEASQVNLLLAGLAMSCARRVVVVGDQRQLPPIPVDAANGLMPPAPAYDCQRNLLASLPELYGAGPPADAALRALPVRPGHHRVLQQEVLRRRAHPVHQQRRRAADDRGAHGRGQPHAPAPRRRPLEPARDRCHRRGSDPGALPRASRGRRYRRHHAVPAARPTKAADVLDQAEADTVHKFQGRQKQVVILTTVLDETWRGRTGLPFVDDPQMINVAVSRAIQRFIVVTNYDMLPTSRHIRDLVGYIRYHNPGEDVVDSAVVSVFDLLYRAYSQRLRPLAARLRKELKYPSEDIIWTVLHDILAEERYAHLTVSSQVLLRNLLPDLSRLTAGVSWPTCNIGRRLTSSCTTG